MKLTPKQLNKMAADIRSPLGEPHDHADYVHDVGILLADIRELRGALEDVNNTARNRLISAHLVPGTPKHKNARLVDAVRVIEEIVEITARVLP